jgi:beta-glucanase (GH16 family)
MKLNYFLAVTISLLLCNHLVKAQNNTYVDLSAPVTNPATKSNHTLIFSDEFSGSRSAYWNYTSVYNTNYEGYCWGNGAADYSFYNKISNQSFPTVSGIGQVIRLATVKESTPYTPDASSLPPKQYTTEMLASDNCVGGTTEIQRHSFQYGYFEMKSKNPKARYMWPAFWLFGGGGGNSEYNEIDGFEFATNDWAVLTNHFQTNGNRTANGKFIFSMPGQTFGDTWVTYGIKWEPNKIIWYINNKPVKIVTDQYDPSIGKPNVIPSIPMSIIANSGCQMNYTNYDFNLPESFPNYMDIDYIRVFQRSNHLTPSPDVVFNINGQQSYSSSSPIPVPVSNIVLNASESYMPNHLYFIAVADLSTNVEVNDWFQSNSVNDITNFDLKAFASSKGMTMTAGKNYRVKVAGANPWIELSQYISVNSCATPVPVLKVNGQNTLTWPSAIPIPYNAGKSRIVIDMSGSTSCDNNYFIALQEINAAGTTLAGSEISKWLSAAEKNNLAGYDLEKFSTANGFLLTPGKYYKLKLVASGTPWTEKNQIIYINPCTTTVSCTINGVNNTFPTATFINNGQDIFLDGSASKFCDNQYFLAVQKCDAGGAGIGSEFSEVKPYFLKDPTQGYYAYEIGRLNIREFCKKKNLTLECGQYYRIKLAGGNPWQEQNKMIYINPCSNVNSDFRIFESYHAMPASGTCGNTTYTFDANNTIDIWAQNSISCDNNYFLAVQECSFSGGFHLIGPEMNNWLAPIDVYNLRQGGLDLKTFAKDDGNPGTTGSITMANNKTYLVKLVASAGTCNSNTWVECVKYINTLQGARMMSLNEENENNTFISIFPNPNNGNFTIEPNHKLNNVSIEIVDMLGKTIYKTLATELDKFLIDLSQYEPGMYYVHISGNGFRATEKVVKQ